MEYINTSAWRVDPQQVVSEVTARLLTWMSRDKGSSILEPDQVAAYLHDGLRELMDAQAVAVLVRRPSDDGLALLASTGIESELLSEFEIADEGDQRVARRFPGAALIGLAPCTPFFPTEATPAGQVLLGELCEYVRETCSAVEGSAGFGAAGLISTGGVLGFSSGRPTEDDPVESPSLIVPLVTNRPGPHEITCADRREVVGLALLWIASPDGTIPGSLRAPLEAAALQGGGWLADALRLERVGTSYRNLGAVFANAIDVKDTHRTGHSITVSHYCGLIAESMGLPEHEVEQAEFAGLMHGIGKLAVPDSVLFKTDSLTSDERELVRAATVSGSDWIGNVDGLEAVANMIRYQSECYDGSGYPEGLRGDEIPLGSRILAVALRFAAMTQHRSDRRAMSVVSGAFESLANDSGKVFDPHIVQAFLASMGRTL